MFFYTFFVFGFVGFDEKIYRNLQTSYTALTSFEKSYIMITMITYMLQRYF